MKVDNALLRKYLSQKFNVPEFDTFLADYFPLVFNDIPPRMLLSERIEVLLGHCRRDDRYKDLFAALKRERPDFDQDDFTDKPQPVPTLPKPLTAPIKRNPHQIFISHAHQDAYLAKRLATDLQEHGWQVWIAPDSIQPGEKWVEAVNRGLAESGKVLLLLTPDAAASTYVRDETNAVIEFKRHGEQIEILPLDVKLVPPTDLPFTWLSFHRISFPNDYKDGLENLLNALQPKNMKRLNRLYDQLKTAVGDNDWETVQTVGEEILAQYPDYRETTQLLHLAQQQKQERKKHQSGGSQLVLAWSWGLLLIPFVVWGLWVVVNNGGDEDMVVALNATATAQTIAFEATLDAHPENMPDNSEPIQRSEEATTITHVPTVKPTEMMTTTPESMFTALPTPTITPDINILPIDVELGDKWMRPTDGMDMVFVPDGTFMMGSTLAEIDSAVERCADLYAAENVCRKSFEDESPQHEVTLSSFWIDQTEVTNLQFSAFLKENGNQMEGDVTWLNMDDPDVQIVLEGIEFVPKIGFEDHPVTNVSWYGASAYCQWVEGILPSEAQWEYAARGDDGRIYPWGNEFDGYKANYCDINCSQDWVDMEVDDGFPLTAPVGSFSPSGESWVGAVDMAGNVWEWVSDWYGSDYYENAPADNPTGFESGDLKVLRGGGWDGHLLNLRVANRVHGDPSFRGGGLGFRCVMSPG